MQTHHKILVVEDNIPSAGLLREILEQVNYQVLVAEDGRKAVEIAQTELPDLAIIDVMLPTLNGFEVCSHIRHNPSLANIPIIMLTVLNESHHRIRAIQAGATDFLTKPFNRLEMLTKVKFLLSKKDEFSMKEDFNDITYCLMTALEERYPQVVEHSRRVAKFSEELSIRLGLASSIIEEVKIGALLHDVGKLACKDTSEWDKHALIGYNMLLRFHRPIIQEIVRIHHKKIELHESYDNVYSSGADLSVQIVAICNRYDNLIKNNFQDIVAVNKVLELLFKEGKTGYWDTKVYNEFKKMTLMHTKNINFVC